MEFWNRQIKMARYMLLGTVIVTVLNIAFLLMNVDMYISYCAALPYYLVWFGKLFDNGLYVGMINSDFTATGLMMAGILLALWLLLWWLAGNSRAWLRVGLVAVALDLAVVLAISVVFLGGLGSCIWDAVLHGAVIYEIAQGLKAWKQKEASMACQARQVEEPDLEYV